MNQASISLLKKADWLNPPLDWSMSGEGGLVASSRANTDFWRKTHYGFIRDDGHALLMPQAGEFSATVTFEGDYDTLYDQAGLMVRAGPETWVKFGIELTDGATHLSSVVTRDVSDWSARSMSAAQTEPVTIRATRIGDALLLQSRDAHGNAWVMERLVPWLAEATETAVGPYLCSPEREGFTARFTEFALEAPQVRQLHT